MDRPYEEWLRQADYDLETAEILLRAGRLLTAVFNCHLAVEKTIKGLWHARLNEVPPKTHDLLRLLKGAGVQPPEDIGRFLVRLNELNITTRYPESLDATCAQLTQDATEERISKAKEAILWIKRQF